MYVYKGECKNWVANINKFERKIVLVCSICIKANGKIRNERESWIKFRNNVSVDLCERSCE